jgi:hypothetical protein
MRRYHALKRPWRMAAIVWMIGLTLSACAGAAASPSSTPLAVSTNEPPAATEGPAPQIPTASEGNLYTNEQGGFSLTLPDGWSAAGPFEVQADGLSYQSYALGLDPAAEGGPGMSRIVIGDASSLTLEAFVQQQCQTCPENPVEDVKLDGRPAQRVLIGGGGVPFTVEWTFVRLDGQMVGFSIHDPETLEPLPDVLGSVDLP